MTERPRVRPDHVVGDKGYSSKAIRTWLRRRNIPHTIPERPCSRSADAERRTFGPASPSPAQWLDGEENTRQRWETLVTARRDHLDTAR
ncbi:hypothetical protein ACFVRD_35330 [Streptomyces sp. NPDC057908]|uniref:hypothetical protein n=1 Tax=Streptomyces sp. NPDC057908 TaxID=3346276 RepID=UPI0036EE470A